MVATFPGRAFWPYWVPAKNFHFWLSHRFLLSGLILTLYAGFELELAGAERYRGRETRDDTESATNVLT